MTKKELIKKLENMSEDKVIIISDRSGWCNIDAVEEKESNIELLMEKHPVFSEN
jgi:hypothetical protein